MGPIDPASPTIDLACNQAHETTATDHSFCTIGDLTSTAPIEVAIYGDSHALYMMPAFATLAKDERRKFAFATLSGCPPILGVDNVKGNHSPGTCPRWNDEMYNYVQQQKIKIVILVARWSLYTEGDDYQKAQSGYFLVNGQIKANGQESSRQVFRDSLGSTIDKLRQLGTKVFIVEQIPQQKNDPRLAYLRLNSTGMIGTTVSLDLVKRLSVELESHLALQKFNRDAFAYFDQKKLITTINFDSYFCDSKVCLMGNDTFAFYRDKNHINAWMANSLVADLRIKIK